MKTKKINGLVFEVVEDEKVKDGNFFGKNIVFTQDVFVAGDLCCDRYIAEKGIKIMGNDVTQYWQNVGGSQEVGGSQDVGGWQKVGKGMVIGLSSTVGGTSEVGLRVFVGVCPWNIPSDADKTFTCKRLLHGEVAYGILVEREKKGGGV